MKKKEPITLYSDNEGYYYHISSRKDGRVEVLKIVFEDAFDYFPSKEAALKFLELDSEMIKKEIKKERDITFDEINTYGINNRALLFLGDNMLVDILEFEITDEREEHIRQYHISIINKHTGSTVALDFFPRTFDVVSGNSLILDYHCGIMKVINRIKKHYGLPIYQMMGLCEHQHETPKEYRL